MPKTTTKPSVRKTSKRTSAKSVAGGAGAKSTASTTRKKRTKTKTDSSSAKKKTTSRSTGKTTAKSGAKTTSKSSDKTAAKSTTGTNTTRKTTRKRTTKKATGSRAAEVVAKTAAAAAVAAIDDAIINNDAITPELDGAEGSTNEVDAVDTDETLVEDTDADAIDITEGAEDESDDSLNSVMDDINRVEALVDGIVKDLIVDVGEEEGAEIRRKITAQAAQPIYAVWVEYKDSPSESLRNDIIEHYLDLVRYTAERMHMRLPGEVDVEDLMSAGLFGLMDAIDAFDLARGVKFETYCTQRIRGAIFDELRAMDWVPRLVRSRTAKVDKARKSLEMELGRKATEDEIHQKLAVSTDEYEKLQRDSKPVGVVSLNRKWYETDSSKDVREIDVIQDKRQENPLSELQRSDLKLLITKGLSRAERLIIVLYYYEEMTMKEIGLTLDLSESRVSQMHSSILARLKAQMQHRSKEF